MTGSDGSVRICTRCGYGRGFHVFFEPGGEDQLRIGLICPSCGQSYRLGWLIPAGDGEPLRGDVY